MQEEMRTLPKNIRQIGQIQEEYRIYVEDYVSTYLNQVAGEVQDKARVLLLLGEFYQEEDRSYYFVRGAIAAQEEYEIGKDALFTDEAWQYYHERQQDYFPGMQVVGRALVKGELGSLSEEYISGQILQDSEWKGLLFFEIDRYNCVDRFYVCGAPLRRACSGYYIYYDKNPDMQNYLITWNEQKGKEPNSGEKEVPVRHFREVMREKHKEETGLRPGTIVAACLLIALTVYTVSSLNRYDKLKGFDEVLGDIADFVDDKLSGFGETIEVTGDEKKPSGSEVVAENTDGKEPGNGDTTQDEDTIQNPDTTDIENGQHAGDPTGSDAMQTPNESDGQSGQQGNEDMAQLPNASDSQSERQQDTADNANITDITEQNGNSDVAENTDIEESEAMDTADDENRQEAVQPAGSDKSYTVYIVKQGDTLFGISRQYYGDVHMVKQICDLNGIENGDSIYFGQKILLP